MNNPQKDERRRAAFMGGWEDALHGRVYAAVNAPRTHANMGNLFGWVFGDKGYEFREVIWNLYRRNAPDIEEG